MGNVYHHANTVVIFLGLPNPWSRGKVEKNTPNRTDTTTDASKSPNKPSGTGINNGAKIKHRPKGNPNFGTHHLITATAHALNW